MSHELTEALVDPLTRLGLTVERAGLSLRVAADLERVMTLTPSKEGLVLCHQLGPASNDPGLYGRLNRLNRNSSLARYVARDTGVWVETYLPYGARSLAANQLHLACGELDRAIELYQGGAGAAGDAVDRGAVTQMQPAGSRELAATAAMPATTALPAPAATVALPQAPGLGEDRQVAETVALPQSDVLPASYMPGKGQRGRDQSLTRRYGSRDQVPGRPEPQRAASDSSGAGPGLFGVVLLLGLLVASGAGVVIAYQSGWFDESAEVATTEPDSEATPAEPVAPAEVPEPTIDDPPADEPVRPAGGWAELGADSNPEPKPSGRVPKGIPAIVEWVRENPERAREGVRAAFHDRSFDEPGNWSALIEALGSSVQKREIVSMLATRVQQQPPPLADSLKSFPRSVGSLRYALIERVVRCQVAERESVAEVLRAARSRDTPDLAIEQGLVRICMPSPDSLERLVERNGDDWIVFGPGRALLEGLATEAAAELAPLKRSPSPRVRATVAELGALSADARAGLTLLKDLLRDPLVDVRLVAIESMVKLDSPLASWPLARRLELEEDGTVQSRLRSALRNLDPRGTSKRLAQLYTRKSSSDRRAALLALETLGSSDAVATILKALNDRDATLQLQALHQLSRMQRQPGLKPHVRKGTPRIRELAHEHPQRDVAQAARDLFVQLTGRPPR